MSEPEITCVIPTFNNRTQLGRAVASSLDQQGVAVQVLLVDDCSDGPTRDFIEKLAEEDPRIRTFFLSRNGGQSQARNLGGMLAHTPFLTFLDQDDEHEPGWYAHALQRLRDDPAMGAYSGRARIVDLPARLGVDETDIRVSGLTMVFTSNIVLRRSIFLATGGFPIEPIWRTPVAGEDGAYRHGLARNWHMVQSGHPALLHRAREGGATVFYLDRSRVEGDRVVITQPGEIETNGELAEAYRRYWARCREMAAEIRGCGPGVGEIF